MTITDINAKKPPVIYSVRIAQHWDGHLEYFLEDIAPDERSLNSVAWALRQMADALEKESMTNKTDCQGLEGHIHTCTPKVVAWMVEHSASSRVWLTNSPNLAKTYEEIGYSVIPLCRCKEPEAAAPEDFDKWLANPYTKVLQESIANDYVPKADCRCKEPDAAEPVQAEAKCQFCWNDLNKHGHTNFCPTLAGR